VIECFDKRGASFYTQQQTKNEHHESETVNSRENWNELAGVKEQSMTTVLLHHSGVLSIGEFYNTNS
jgi:hypothetical protein